MEMSNINTTDGSYVNYPSCFFSIPSSLEDFCIYSLIGCALQLFLQYPLSYPTGCRDHLKNSMQFAPHNLSVYVPLSIYSLISSRRCHLTTSFKIEKPTIPTLFTETHGCHLGKVGAATCISYYIRP